MALLRVSLGYFFLRIIHGTTQRRIIYGIMISYSLFSFGYFWYTIFQCGVPTKEHFWEKKTLSKCGPGIRGLVVGYFHSAITAGADFTFLVLPLPVILKSNLNSRERTGVILLLCLSMLGCVASLIRIKWVPAVVDLSTDIFCMVVAHAQRNLLTLIDKGFWLAIWSAIEPGLGIIASSATCLRPLARDVRAYTSSRGTRTQSKPSQTSESSNSKGIPVSQDNTTVRNNHKLPEPTYKGPTFLSTQNSEKSQMHSFFHRSKKSQGLTATHHIDPPRRQYRPSTFAESQFRSPTLIQQTTVSENEEESDFARWNRRQQKMNQRYNPKRHSGLPLGILDTRHDGDDDASLFR